MLKTFSFAPTATSRTGLELAVEPTRNCKAKQTIVKV